MLSTIDTWIRCAGCMQLHCHPIIVSQALTIFHSNFSFNNVLHSWYLPLFIAELHFTMPTSIHLLIFPHQLYIRNTKHFEAFSQQLFIYWIHFSSVYTNLTNKCLAAVHHKWHNSWQIVTFFGSLQFDPCDASWDITQSCI